MSSAGAALQGTQFSFLWKFLFCWLGILLSISLPSWHCGAELSQGVDCVERRKKKGRFHLTWINLGKDFLPEILIWNRFFPVVVYNLWRTSTGMDSAAGSTSGAVPGSGKRWIGILAHEIKNQFYSSHGLWKPQHLCKKHLGRIYSPITNFSGVGEFSWDVGHFPELVLLWLILKLLPTALWKGRRAGCSHILWRKGLLRKRSKCLEKHNSEPQVSMEMQWRKAQKANYKLLSQISFSFHGAN